MTKFIKIICMILMYITTNTHYCMDITTESEHDAVTVGQLFKETEQEQVCTTKKFIDPETQNLVYQGFYPFRVKEGLIRIKQSIRGAQEDRKIALTLDRHVQNSVIIRAFLDTIYTHDPCINDINQKYQLASIPWSDDVIKQVENLQQAKCHSTLHGGNRLKLCLLGAAVNYTITVPTDADVEVILKEADVEYRSQANTQLHIAAPIINSGSDTSVSLGDQIWACYLVNKADPMPITDIVVKKGKVKI